MKPIFYSYLFACIASLFAACNPVCDDTLNNSVDHYLVCTDTSNLITKVKYSYQSLTTIGYQNELGNDSVNWNIALDKPNTAIIIEREKNTDTIFYTIRIKKTFEPKSDCEDNNLVYKTDSILINKHTCKSLRLYDDYVRPGIFSAYLDGRYIIIE